MAAPLCQNVGKIFPQVNRFFQFTQLYARKFSESIHSLSIKDILSLEKIGKKFETKAWIRGVRHHKGVTFLDINDGSTAKNLQVVLKTDAMQNDNDREDLAFGSSVVVCGQLVESKSKGQAVELLATDVNISGKCDAESYPLKTRVHHSLEYTRRYPHLRSRSPVSGALTRLRSAATMAVHSFFQGEGYVNVHTPILTSSDCEGAGELFEVVPSVEAEENTEEYFFGVPVYLTVSGQLQLETIACSHSKAYTFGPTFRAENSRTRRHLAEFYMVEAEIAFTQSLLDLTQAMEKFVKSVADDVYTKCDEDLKCVHGNDRLNHVEEVRESLQKHFHVLSYTEAIDILTKHAKQFEFRPSWGVDLHSEHEHFLVKHCGGVPTFVVDYPGDIKPFYARDNGDNKTVAAVDLLVPGVGELIGGSLREERLDILQHRLQHMGLHAEYQWYLDLRRFGSVPHGGFGLGFERLLQYLLGVDHIRDVIPFPRFPGSCPL